MDEGKFSVDEEEVEEEEEEEEEKEEEEVADVVDVERKISSCIALLHSSKGRPS